MERAKALPTGAALLKARTPGRQMKRDGSHERVTRFLAPGDRTALIRLAFVVAGLHGVAAALLLIAYAVGSDLPT